MFFLSSFCIINIYHNNIFKIPTEISFLTNLIKLDLNNNSINTLKKIKYLINLEELDLCYNNLKIISKEIKYLINLKKINISENSLSISVDNLSDIKKSINVNNGLINDDDCLSVDIIKETGFTINRGYSMRSQYLDPKIYDEILPVASNKLKKINSENFSDIWNNVMKESGLMRDNNIDELLKKLDV